MCACVLRVYSLALGGPGAVTPNSNEQVLVSNYCPRAQIIVFKHCSPLKIESELLGVLADSRSLKRGYLFIPENQGCSKNDRCVKRTDSSLKRLPLAKYVTI